jgi:hypothetical protein
MKNIVSLLMLCMVWGVVSAQVDTTFIYRTDMPYGTLDIRIAKSSSRYYYLQPNKTISYREVNGARTNTYLDMTTNWDSSPYTQGNMREKNGTSDYFIMNYRLLFPNNYSTSYDDGYPLIVMMHGAGERGNCWDNNCYHGDRTWTYATNTPPAPETETHELMNNDHNLSQGGKYHLDARNAAGTRFPNDPSMPSKAFPGFILFPQNLNGWSSTPVQDAIRLVRLVVKKYNINPNRIYIHGLSNGGAAVYEAIKRAPWLFAAALPMSAVSDNGALAMAPSIAHIPLWIFQGGIDTAPTPAKTEEYVRQLRNAGASVRYTIYSHLGHGVWNTAYREPDFFKWMLSQSKANIHAFAASPAICKTNGQGVKLEVAAGFFKYQWERNGSIISGATNASYVATSAGTYRARFSRIANPSSSQWNDWSPALTVTELTPPQAKMEQIGTVLLRDLNNFTDAKLKASGDFAHYYWYRNGSRIDLPGSLDDTVQYATIKPGDCTSTCTGSGSYTLVVADYNNCPSPASTAKRLYFNNQAPINITAPGSFTGSAASASSIKLNWSDASSNEEGFEVWRRKVITSTTFSSWSMPVITAAGIRTFTDTGLEPSTKYQYKIRAVSSGGRSNYTPSSSTQYLEVTTSVDNVAPGAPSALTAAQSAVNTVTLSWTGATDNTGIKEYVIYYGSKSVSTGSPQTSYVLKNLTVNTNYSFTVKARDLGGNVGSASNSASANTYMTGLYYEHSTGAWSSIDAINWNIAEFKGTMTRFTISPRTQEDYFNFHYDGYLYINTSGTYQFQTTSSDGTRVEIDGTVVVNNDGIHDALTATGSTRTLSAGPRRITAKYFEYTGSATITVKYKGPDTGNAWMTIPESALRSSGSGTSSGGRVGEPEEEQQITNDQDLVNIYPNPASSGDLNLQLARGENEAEGETIDVSLIDMNGRAYFEKQIYSEEAWHGVRLNSDLQLNNGMYLMVIKQNGKTTKKLIAIRN